MMQRVRQGWDAVYRGASAPEVVAAAIERGLTAAAPPDRIVCGHRAGSVIARRLLPTPLWDRIIRSQMT